LKSRIREGDSPKLEQEFGLTPTWKKSQLIRGQGRKQWIDEMSSTFFIGKYDENQSQTQARSNGNGSVADLKKDLVRNPALPRRG